MKTYTFPKANNPQILDEMDGLMNLFDYLEEKIRDYHLIGNHCSQRAGRIEQTISDNFEDNPIPKDTNSKEENEFLEKMEGLKADYNMWIRREDTARKNERNLFKVKRMIQKAFAKGELEK